MEAWQGLLAGFEQLLNPTMLLACLAGCLVGTLVGVLPGLGPVGAISLLLPLTFNLDVTTALVMLAGIYYGSMYGGSTTSILVNVPGEAASVVTCLDGYQMAKKGRAGPALSIAAIGSFVAGTFGVLMLTLIAAPLARLALRFGPPEFAALALLGFIVLSRLSGGSVLRSYVMVVVGVMLSTVGMDLTGGMPRFTFGVTSLLAGFDFIPVIMGLYGLAEVLRGLEEINLSREIIDVTRAQLLPSREDIRRSLGPIGRGSVVGFLLGLIPGPANIISTFVSYSVERGLSRRKEEFGQGAIEGVAGPESANNAASAGALVPLLLLGVPFSPLPAVLLAAFMIHGVLPGPLMLKQQPAVFWGIVASMYVGNVALLVLNLPLVTVFARVAKLKGRILMPIVAAFCFLGAFAVRNSAFDLLIVAVFGIVGYVLQRSSFSPAPLALGMIIGPMFEDAFRQSSLLFDGNLLMFFTRPFAAAMLLVGLAVLATSVIGSLREGALKRRTAKAAA